MSKHEVPAFLVEAYASNVFNGLLASRLLFGLFGLPPVNPLVRHGPYVWPELADAAKIKMELGLRDATKSVPNEVESVELVVQDDLETGWKRVAVKVTF